MKKNNILLIILVITGLLYSADPVVDNVRVEQRTDGSLLVDVYYDLSDGDSDTITVVLNLSKDNGQNWMPCSSVSGDIGTNIIPSTDKHVVWDFLTDYPITSGNSFQVKVIAADKETLLDIDGNIYQTVPIGSQVWMAEDLRVTHYRNGDPIPHIIDNVEWSRLSSGAFCYYDHADSNAANYGALYNWFAVNDERNIAPKGWHVPTDQEWKELEIYLGMSQSEADDSSWRGPGVGDKLKDTDIKYWTVPNTGATNESGFSARPGGYCNSNNGSFHSLGETVLYWTATEYSNIYACDRNLHYEDSEVYRGSSHKRIGMSVRLIRDEPYHPGLTEISISPQDTTLYNGELYQFTCIANYSDGSTEDITLNTDWSIISGNCGSIDSQGWFIADSIATGKVILQVKYEGFTDEASVIVKHATGILTDIDGNIYQTVRIGKQWWMAENLKVTHYRNGDQIPNVTNTTEWTGLNSGAYCYYNNYISYADDYGALYNWHAVVDDRNIAPEGWHVPTDDEWKQLEMFLGMSQGGADNTGFGRGTNEGGKLKETGTIEAGNGLWHEPNVEATNESGFSARPAGYRSYYSSGTFGSKGGRAYYWAATEYSSSNAWNRELDHYNQKIARYDRSKKYGLSIRLVRDN